MRLSQNMANPLIQIGTGLMGCGCLIMLLPFLILVLLVIGAIISS